MESVLKQNLKSNLVFGDLLAGTGVVGEHLNKGLQRGHSEE